MICKWCNKEINDSAKFCPNCGGNVQDNTINKDEMVEQTIVNNVQPQPNIASVKEQKANVWLVILSVFIPIAGLIIFLIKKDDEKKTAKASGIAALISFGVSILITIISVVLLFSAAGKFVGDVIDDAIDNSYDYEDNDNYSDDDSQNVNASTEWKNYEVIINGKTLKLPCTYNELSLATEAKVQSSYEKSYLQANYYATINMYKDDKLALYAEFLNDTDNDILYTESKITRVSQTKYHATTDAEIIIFPGGLKVGQEITKDEIVNLFGEPSDIYNYESDGYISDTYTYAENIYYSTTNNYKIKVVNGIIDELSLDHRNYK